MRRTTVAAVLVVAGLLGGAGGSYAAFSTRSLQATPGDGATAPSGSTASPRPGAGSSATSSGPGTPTASSADPGGNKTSGPPLFYFADDRIRDGDRSVPVTLSRDYRVESVRRAGDGWLVVQLQSEGGEQENYFGTYVYPDGATWELGPLGQTWDIDDRGRVLFSPQEWSWFAADPQTHKLVQLDIVEGSSEEPPYMNDGDPAPWIQWAGTGMLTGWETPEGSRMVISDGASDTEVGPVGIYRPNTSPDGRLAVGSAPPEPQAEPICLSGGKLTGEQWWQNCDYMRLSYSSPYSPDGAQLLALDTHLEGSGLSRFAILDARTGERTTWVDAPKGTYDAAWNDDRSLTLLARPPGSKTETSVVYRAGLDGSLQKVGRLQGPVGLGDA